jgi:hypothetical protein
MDLGIVQSLLTSAPTILRHARSFFLELGVWCLVFRGPCLVPRQSQNVRAKSPRIHYLSAR